MIVTGRGGHSREGAPEDRTLFSRALGNMVFTGNHPQMNGRTIQVNDHELLEFTQNDGFRAGEINQLLLKDVRESKPEAIPKWSSGL